MPTPKCGTRIRRQDSPAEVCTAGCLVTYAGQPNKVLLLTVCHGLVTSTAQPGDLIVFDDDVATPLGRLEMWTSFRAKTIEADAALVWIDPDKIDIEIAGLGRPTGVVDAIRIGSELSILTGGTVRSSTILDCADIPVHVSGPGGWSRDRQYLDQIVCSTQFSQKGDSGTIALDNRNQVVGMVVAVTKPEEAVPVDGHTIITPINTILTYQAFGDQLRILTALPQNPIKPA